MSPSSLLSLSVLLLCSLNVVKCHKLMFKPRIQEYEALHEDKDETVPCSDGGSCADGQTCCQTASGLYGCCPHPNAVCCYDKTSCCPNGFTCDVPDQKCLRASTNETKPMLKKRLATVSEPKQQKFRDHDVPCPGGGSCADGQTCCLLASGQYGCCPYPNAVCCSDKASCCPDGYKCDVPDQKCIQASTNDTKPMMKTHLTTATEPKQQKFRDHDVPCPGGGSCADGQTCCLLASGQYGCCPYPNAVCCSDKASCCPDGYKCDVPDQKCIQASTNDIKPMMKTHLTTVDTEPKQQKYRDHDVPCPGGGSCADGQTCCLLASGQYGCCPYPNAVCCSDKASCCPDGYKCDVPDQKCIQASTNDTKPMLKTHLTTVDTEPKQQKYRDHDVPCPGGGSCADGQTCCLLASGQYGCCPYPNAVCCSDKASCCPDGYKCDVPDQKCIQASTNDTKPMLKTHLTTVDTEPKQQKYRDHDVPCPGGGSCADGQTCCLLASGQYGCCPYPNAVCCSDKASCCPDGYKCDVPDQKCIQASTNDTKPMLKTQLTTVTEPKQQKFRDHDVPCPGGGSCADGQTCCLLASGQYGCCPYPNAVCCSDKASCCPDGYKCDVPDQKCIQASTNDTKPMLKKRLATVSEPKEPDYNTPSSVPCPDGGYCADGQTCCQLASGVYGCCPYADAVCCSDLATCCPNGYTCDVPNHQCIQAAIDTVKLVALKVPVTLSEDLDRPSSDRLVCPDSTTCAGTSACCRTYTNTYSCCVYPNDVCCDDGLHCCPRLTICDQRTLTCLPGSKSAPWERPVYSVPATPKPNKVDSSETASTVVCPSGTSCAGTAACCRTYSGTYNCCNYPNDVCCSDGLHCCARGSICDLRTLTCLPGKEGGSLTWYTPKPAVPSV